MKYSCVICAAGSGTRMNLGYNKVFYPISKDKTVLDLMNKKVDRDMSNLMNRQINCISANLDKTVNASLKQMKAIEVIQNTIGLQIWFCLFVCVKVC